MQSYAITITVNSTLQYITWLFHQYLRKVSYRSLLCQFCRHTSLSCLGLEDILSLSWQQLMAPLVQEPAQAIWYKQLTFLDTSNYIDLLNCIKYAHACMHVEACEYHMIIFVHIWLIIFSHKECGL